MPRKALLNLLGNSLNRLCRRESWNRVGVTVRDELNPPFNYFGLPLSKSSGLSHRLSGCRDVMVKLSHLLSPGGKMPVKNSFRCESSSIYNSAKVGAVHTSPQKERGCSPLTDMINIDTVGHCVVWFGKIIFAGTWIVAVPLSSMDDTGNGTRLIIPIFL